MYRAKDPICSMATRYMIITFPASINPAARMAKKTPDTISKVLLLKCFEILENRNMTGSSVTAAMESIRPMSAEVPPTFSMTLIK